ncbi:hypothetical protein BJ165DRAFT_1163559 [Panaeolus papilionaceus]|nr:hypothetical protein BJ165DRAFT_1163559 [Panaeolus papilionaceus]
MEQSHLPARFPQSNSLITPSASPPPRHASVQQQFIRPAMSAPPLKRQRVSSTPRRTFHDPSPASSSSRSQPPIDIEKEREASRLRLLSAWENLTRLVRPLDEDDIVNLRTGKITRDNGILRSTPRINFGNMLNPADNEGGDEDSDTGDEGEDETDELDTLSERPLDLDDNAQIDFESGPKVLPPVTPLDPQDNEDLQEFLRAEQQRKELCGSEPESEEEEEDETEEVQTEHEESTGQEEAEDFGIHGDDSEQGATERSSSPDIFPASSCPGDSSNAEVGFSDDELDDWAVDDASFVQPVGKYEEQGTNEAVFSVSDSDSDIEIIEGPYTRSSPIRPSIPKFGHEPAPPKAKSESPQKKHSITQYLTPPLSSSSMVQSTSLGEHEARHEADPKNATAQHEPFLSMESNEILSDTPRVDLTRLHRGKRPAFIRAETSVSISNSSALSRTLQKVHIPKVKPIVLLTPRKPSTSWSYVDNIPSLPHADGKGKQRALSSPPREKRPPAELNRQQSERPEQSSSTLKHGPPKRSVNKRSSDAKSAGASSNIRDKAPKAGPLHKDTHQDSYDSATMNSPRKRKRRSSSGDPHRREIKTAEEPVQTQTASEPDIPGPPARRRSLSRGRHRPYSSGSDSESGSSASERFYPRRTSISRPRTPSHTHKASSYFPDSYSSRNSMPPFGPIPDPRAQFIITQAMQQLSALVTGSWIPPYDGGTPTYYPDPRYPNTYTTPTHRRPSRYDPDFSNATHPPDSPEPSPEKSVRRKSLVRRSRSRGRRVSFHIDDNSVSRDRSSSPAMDQDWNPSPTKPPRDRFRKRGTPFSEKGKARGTTHDSSENSESDADKCSTYVRGQTPGPSWQSGEQEHDKSRVHKSRQ